jgi:hypothetical protein
MPAGITCVYARAFNWQTGHFLHDNQHKCPVCRHFIAAAQDQTPREREKTMKHAIAASRTPFTELASHPEKLEAALRAARSENDAFAATRRYGRYATTSHTATGVAYRSGRSPDGSPELPPEIREVEFQLEAPAATSVMLAATFTAWERFPLGLARMRDGIWSIFVPLLPGIYAYRFIVDGRWCDDPRADLCMPGLPGGSGPALKVV